MTVKTASINITRYIFLETCRFLSTNSASVDVCLFLFFYFYLCFVVYLCPFSLQVSLAARDRLQIFESLREKQKSAKATEAPLSIRLPDGRTVTGTAGVTTPLFVAQSVR